MISKMNKRGISINSLEELKKKIVVEEIENILYKIIDSIEKDEAKEFKQK